MSAQEPDRPAELRFRPAEAADQPFFRELEFSTTWESISPADRTRLGRSEVRDALDQTHAELLARPGSRVIIAENGAGERVGLLWLGVNRNLVSGEEEAWIFNLTVCPEHQGRGIGRRLLQHAEELARAEEFQSLGLMVSTHNERAVRLYERMDFHPANVVMRKLLRRSSGG